MLKEPYIINPSALSYACFHCEYMNINYGLKNEGVRAPVTNVLDTLEKPIKRNQRIILGKQYSSSVS